MTPENGHGAEPKPCVRRTRTTARVVLVVDGHESMLWVLFEAFRAAGFVVIRAKTAEVASTVLDTMPFTSIVTDIDLGGGASGFDLLVSAQEKCPSVPVFLTSGRPIRPEDIAKRGAAGFFQKPFRTSELVAAVVSAGRIGRASPSMGATDEEFG